MLGLLILPGSGEAATVVQPSIGITASRSGLRAHVGMTLSVGRGGGHPSTLWLTVAFDPTNQPFSAAVVLSNFPAETTAPGLRVLNVHPVRDPLASALPAAAVVAPVSRRFRDYYDTRTFLVSGQAAVTLTLKITAPRPIGESAMGSQLRVALPSIVGEVPGINIPAAEAGRDLFGGAAVPPALDSLAALPALLPGQTVFRTSAEQLGSFQILSGDAPTLLGGSSWAWNGINGPTVLGANVAAQDRAQRQFLLGRPVPRHRGRGRRDPDDGVAGTVPGRAGRPAPGGPAAPAPQPGP